MQDASEQQNNTQLNQVLQSSPLSQRLARRSTKPVGVVQLNPFQSQYVRMPGWMVQRSTLLEQLQTRYGTRKEGTGETSNLVLASVMPQPPQAQVNSASLPSSLDTMPQPTAPIRGKLPTHPSASPPSHPFRVSRRVALPPETSSAPKVAISSASEAKRLENSDGIEPTQPSDSSSQSYGNTVSSDCSEPVVRSQILPNNISDHTPPSLPKISEIGGAGGAETSLILRQVSPSISEPVVRSQILPNNISDHTPPSLPKISEIGGAGGAETSLILRQVSPGQSEGLAKSLMLATQQPSNLAGSSTPTSGGNAIASEVQPHSSSSVSPTDAIAPFSPKLESPISMPRRETQEPLVLRNAASAKLDESLGQSIAGKTQFIGNSENPTASEKFKAEISTQSSNLRGVGGTHPQEFHAGVPLKTNVPLILRQAVPVKPDELSKENVSTERATLPPQAKEIRASSTRAPLPETLPLVQTASPSMRLQLQQEHSSTITEPWDALSTATGVDTPNSQRMAVAAEIPVQRTSVSQMGIIWRKSTHESSSGIPLDSQFSRSDKNALPLAINWRNGNEQIARQSISASSSMPQTATEMENSMSADTRPVPAPILTSTHEVNVAQLAEQVSRILSRQLIVERERRGMH